MLRKTIWALVILLAVGAGLFGLYYFNGNTTAVKPIPTEAEFREQMKLVQASTSTAPATVVTKPATTTQSTDAVKVTAITPTSITVQLSSGTRVFAISKNTLVFSTVLVGQSGKSLGDISVGSNIVVYWHKETPDAAASLAFPRDEVIVLTPDEDKNALPGKITNISGGVVTITPTDGAFSRTDITVNPATKIATIVTAGQKGRTLKVGDTVVARGLVTTGQVTTAKAIIIAPAL